MTQINTYAPTQAMLGGLQAGQDQLGLRQRYELANAELAQRQQGLDLDAQRMEMQRQAVIAEQLRQASAARFNSGEFLRLHPPEYQDMGPPAPDGSMQAGPIDPEWQLQWEQFSQAPATVQQGYLDDERKFQNQNKLDQIRRDAAEQARIRGTLAIDEAERSGMVTKEAADQARMAIIYQDAGLPASVQDDLIGPSGGNGWGDPGQVYDSFLDLSGDPTLAGAASLQSQMTGKPPTSGMFTQIPRSTPSSVQDAKLQVEELEASLKDLRAQADAKDRSGDLKGAMALETQATEAEARVAQAKAALARARRAELTRRIKLQDNGNFPSSTGTDQTHDTNPDAPNRGSQLPPQTNPLAPTIDPTKVQVQIGQGVGMLQAVDASGQVRPIPAPKTGIDAINAACELLGIPTDRQLSEEEAQAVASVAQKLRDTAAASQLRDSFSDQHIGTSTLGR